MDFKRAVIKVGSALVAPDGNGCSGHYILAIARFISQCHARGKEIIIVSSGSVAAGRGYIAHGSANPSIAMKQAMAAIGQTQMMANWQRFFDTPCSQLLITHGDLRHRPRYLNIKNTLRVLLENKVIPIVNENDTVATKELKVGDNDNLAAMVAMVSGADCLFILSDVNGVYDKDPNKHLDATLIPQVTKIDGSVYAMATGTTNKLATGGMTTKIQAAEKACEHGIHTYIVNGSRSEVFDQLLQRQNPGTHFVAQQSPMKAKKHWLKHTLTACGTITIDQGAANAVVNRGASLLASGLVKVDGEFEKGELVAIALANNKQIIAKGISQYNSGDLRKIKGNNSSHIEVLLGYCPSKEVVHRDDLVLI
ncbi:glutamate 5-kinase [Thalassotalea aquiviva]|uniref:glutamate 5-kinase n=1 Tax=Thalassotalea aquiviva TaxID=3242415 RepID=UPI00352BA920